MKKFYTKKLIAFVLALAMVLTGGYATTLTGTVAKAAAKKATLKLNPAKLSLTEGKKKTVKIKKTNVKKISYQKWTSSKKSVAAVSAKGVVTAKKAGKATIQCKVKYVAAGFKTAKTKTLKCAVTVKAKAASSAAPSTEPSVSPTPAEPTVDPKTPLNKVLDEKDITLRIESNDKSNVGEEREISIVGGTTETMKVKDNGTMRKELSSQYLADHEMGLGANLGNTMEATLPMADRAKATEATQFEVAWGQPITTQAYIDCLHSYGINTLRIPVAWSNMVSNDGTYTINEKYLGRVEEIVNYALNDGMYVIINDHWDLGWWGQFGAAKFDETGKKKIADEARRAEAWKKYEAYWTQISNRFKDYSDHLIFEGANEELGSRLNDAIYPNGYSSADNEGDEKVSGNLTKEEQYEVTNAINQKFVDVVRSTGGNNTSRHLLIAGFNTNFADSADERFVMPKDPSNPDVNKLFLSVHFYDPSYFCLDHANGSYSVGDQAKNVETFKVLQRFADEGYGIIIGECGIVETTGVDGSLTQWLHDTFTEASKYHAVPVLWEISNYFDRSAAKLKFKDIAVLYNTITGANGDTSMSRVSGKVEISDIAEIDGMTPVWSWTGKWYKNGGDNTVGDNKFEENGGTVVVKKDGMTDDDLLAQFVPQSEVKATIADDATALTFNTWGYQAFLKIDTSKYKVPVIAFDFLEGTDNEDNVMDFKYGANADSSGSDTSISVDYAKFHGKGIVLSEASGYSVEKPYICITFGGKPIVTGIHIYDLG